MARPKAKRVDRVKRAPRPMQSKAEQSKAEQSSVPELLSPPSDPTAQELTVAVDLIAPAEYNRDVGDVSDLAESIASLGLIEPIVVRRQNEPRAKLPSKPYVIIDGERRWLAHKKLGWATIQVVVRDMGLLAQIAANVVRKNVRPSELAESLYRAKELPRTDGKEGTLSGKEIAASVGLSEGYVNNLIRAKRQLHPEIWDMFSKLGAGSSGAETQIFIAASSLATLEEQRAFVLRPKGGGSKPAQTATSSEASEAGDSVDSTTEEAKAPPTPKKKSFIFTPESLTHTLQEAPKNSLAWIFARWLMGEIDTLPAVFFQSSPRGKR